MTDKNTNQKDINEVVNETIETILKGIRELEKEKEENKSLSFLEKVSITDVVTERSFKLLEVCLDFVKSL